MSSSGVFNPGEPGTATITATSTQDSTKFGSATVLVNIPPPSNLVYPQTTLTGDVGQPIPTDTPTVTGTVTSYSVSPALPAGLSLNTATGVISGTPTAITAQANYSVTASNSTGFTSATLQITVTPQPPGNLGYQQSTITAIVNQPITPDTPTVTGTVTSYSVSPALPAGLSLNASTGTISGTPTAAAPQAVYTVSASNAGGSFPSAVTVTVLRAQSAVLDLGHATTIEQIQFEGGNVLSSDYFGHWALWNYASGAELASGDGFTPGIPAPYSGFSIKMAGPTFVVESSNGLEVRAQSDGHLISMIAFYAGGNWWQLASDGTYICIGTNNGLLVYSTTGQLLASKTGDYSKAKAYTAPGQVLVALGPAGQSVIETVSTADGTSTFSPQFSGQFNTWFLDSPRFLTNESTTVWVYSNAAVQQAIVVLPTVAHLIGQGNWISTYDLISHPLEIYPIGSQTASFTYVGSPAILPIPSGTTIAMFPSVSPGVSVIDLSGTTPTETDYNPPIASLSAYAASSASQWMVGNKYGVLLDGASPSNASRYFGLGAAWSIAGSSSNAAIATAIGKDLVYDTGLSTVQETIDFPSGKLALSSDGSVLGALGNAVNFYSLPSENVISSHPGAYVDFALSASGTTIGLVSSSGLNVTPIAGGTSIWSGTSGDIFLSPD